jgi:hypothetical protein
MRLGSCFAALGLGIGLVLAAAPAWAHHSFAADYDSTKPVTLTGAVPKFDWTNCHDGPGDALKPSGWTRTTMKIGDVVTAATTATRGPSP